MPSLKVEYNPVTSATRIPLVANGTVDIECGSTTPSEFEDRYENAVVDMLKRKQAGMPIEPQPEAAPPGNVVNLMDALRRSIAAEKPAEKAAERKRPARGSERRPAKGARKAG